MIERGEIRKTRLLIADDHTLVLEGLKRILEADFDLVGMAENGRDVLRKAEELKPDVVLMDINIEGDIDGIQTAALISAEDLTPVVYLYFERMQDWVQRRRKARQGDVSEARA